MSWFAHAQTPLGTEFLYHGELNDGPTPAEGQYDFTVALCDTPDGTPLQTLTRDNIRVSGGRFTLQLDYGPGVFNGTSHWLAIAVRNHAHAGDYSILTPRQRLYPTPNALYAATAGSVAAGSVTSDKLGAGSVTVNALQNDAVTGAKIADGTITAADVNPASFNTLFWSVGGNAGTTAGRHFLGTTDNQALEIRVAGERALRLEPNGTAAASLAAGYSQNDLSGTAGSTIAGGGTSGSVNRTLGNYAFVGAGHGNWAGLFAAIAGGAYNRAQASFAFVGSGINNSNMADFATLGGGSSNFIQPNATNAVVGGGQQNTASGSFTTLGGGVGNTVAADGATVPGGVNNTAAGANSFAAGTQARALHAGSFVWADSRPGDFPSTRENEFRIRAAGGVRLDPNTVMDLGGFGPKLQWTANTAMGLQPSYDQPQTLYARSPGAFSWYLGGSHDNRAGQPGPGGRNLMTLMDGGLQIYGGGLKWGGYEDGAGGYQGARLTADEGGSIEVGGPYDVVFGRITPFVDFHFAAGLDAEPQDYNVRLINDGDGQLAIIARPTGSTNGLELARFSPFHLSVFGTISSLSDRNAKAGFTSVRAETILERVAALPITRWHYTNDPAIEHIGPVAQDFRAAFSVGTDEKHIDTVDADGIALAAIQGLNLKLESKLKEQAAELAASREELRRALQTIASMQHDLAQLSGELHPRTEASARLGTPP